MHGVGDLMKFVAPRPFADPDVAARKLVEIANSIEAAQDGRICIERVNAPFLAAGGTGEDFGCAGRGKRLPLCIQAPPIG
jgi:hypothetical protein